ncbi:glycosyltransferase family 2 protein [Pseudorhodoferax sp. Leaf274]|uniref:glycosyltransferase family 2 protein n=1 Tax=Pseudorhodoferax sp. Leaf274 TaxID=1736318 RepID=UPI000702C392|nr:glycosyltransferase family 2 protein [Pseudorhodoferax sp. Leaf274]KQP39785.1 hypothetical protein ASF44_08650 [Pseudorhodoferax sp. Leaf274]
MPTPNAPRVLVVILNWNAPADTLACLQSLRASDYRNQHILVIDNGSTDDSLAVLSREEGIDLLANPENLGFTGGCNLGLQAAARYEADYVWLLNNDTQVASDCLSELVRAAQADHRIGLLSPVLYHRGSDSIQHGGSRYHLDPPTIEETADLSTARRWQNETPEQLVLWGTALLIPRATLERVGLLDARLFAYSEDTDYSIRCGLAGLRKCMVDRARVWHSWNNGVRKPYYYYYTTRNDLLMWRRHVSLATYLRVAFWNYRRTVRVLARLQDQPEHRQACMLGFWDGLAQRTGIYTPGRRAPRALQAMFRNAAR